MYKGCKDIGIRKSEFVGRTKIPVYRGFKLIMGMRWGGLIPASDSGLMWFTYSGSVV